MTIELVAVAVVFLVVKVVASARTARKEREESKRIAWKYLTRPTTVTQLHKGPIEKINPPRRRVQ